MDVLILSCKTGGGHNAAARAIREEFLANGHQATLLDPYALISDHTAQMVGNAYIKLVQHMPALFGVIYQMGDLYRRLPVSSPVYHVNGRMKTVMQGYLAEHPFDLVVMTHLFPAEILTYMKHRGKHIPKMIFVATDYTCIPFTEETDCDAYVIPGRDLLSEFHSYGILADRLHPLGIPVRPDFQTALTKAEAKRHLGLDETKKYLLLAGGSIGAGSITKTTELLCRWCKTHESVRLIVICGNNQSLYESLKKSYGKKILLEGFTDRMAVYMKACDLLLSKPGGLSSTEAAVVGVPMIHIDAIPGCETKNEQYFQKHGMSLAVQVSEKTLLPAVERLLEYPAREKMVRAQRQTVSRTAAADIRKLAETIGSE